MTANLVVIGVSTGGPIALKQFFTDLPPLDAAFVIVLHVPVGMDYKIAKSLEGVASMPVSLAQNGGYAKPGQVYLAPGGLHLSLEGNSRFLLREGPRVNFVQPAADVAMLSLARPPKGVRLAGVVLTGMGRDGAEGIRHIKSIGGVTFAQERESCAIYGMPRAAVETGAVDFELTPQGIARKLRDLLGGSRGGI